MISHATYRADDKDYKFFRVRENGSNGLFYAEGSIDNVHFWSLAGMPVANTIEKCKAMIQYRTKPTPPDKFHPYP